MDSEHNSNLCDESDCKLCNAVGSSLEDCSSQMTENMTDILSNNPGSQEYQENESNVPQNVSFSADMPPATECNPSKYCQPSEEISNTLVNSPNFSYQSSEVKSNVLQDKEKPFCEAQSSGNQGMSFQLKDSPKTELRSTEKEISQCKQPCQIEGLQASETAPSVNKHLFTERQQRPGSRCHLVQETKVQTNLGELCVYQDLGPSPQQLSESYMNPTQMLDSASQQQSRNVQVVTRSSHPVCINHPHQSTAAEESFMPQLDCYRNEFIDNQIPTSGVYLRYTPRPCKIEDLHSTQFQQSVRRFNYIESLYRKRCTKYKSGEASIQGSIPQRLQQPKSVTKSVHVDSKKDFNIDEQQYPMNLVIKESKVNQDLCPQQPTESRELVADEFHQSNIDQQHYPTNLAIKESNVNQDLCPQQPTESRALVSQGFHQVPLVYKVSNSTVRHVPYSLNQQRSNQRPQVVQSVERVIYTRQGIISPQELHLRRFLFDRFLETCINQNVPSSQDQAPPHYDLRDLQYPYSNRAEVMNILVFGPTSWTSRILQTYSRGNQLSVESPYSLSLTKNVTRGGIVTSVSIYQVEDLIKSLMFMRSCCHSGKSTVMLVFTVSDQGIEEIINIVRCRVSRNVPINFVGCKHNLAGNKVLKFLKTGYMLKSRNGLSSFLVCKADSEEEVDSVFNNAIDVALLCTP